MPPSKLAHTQWSMEEHGNATASPDVSTFLVRERRALAAFCAAWAEAEPDASAAAALRARAEAHEEKAAALRGTMAAALWRWEEPLPEGGGARRGWWRSWDAKKCAAVDSRTYQLAWPAWEGIGEADMVQACLAELSREDMRGRFGVRSTSKDHPVFSLEDAIVPYSIWRGPVWINVNCCLAYALARGGRREEALALGEAVVAALAADLRACGAWHECYNPDTGAPTCAASKHFLSWNMLAAQLLDNLARGVDPTSF